MRLHIERLHDEPVLMLDDQLIPGASINSPPARLLKEEYSPMYFVRVDAAIAPEGLPDLKPIADFAPNLIGLSISCWDNYEAPIVVTDVDAERSTSDAVEYESQVRFDLQLLKLSGREHVFASFLGTNRQPLVNEVRIEEDAIHISFKFDETFDTLRDCEQHTIKAAHELVTEVRKAPDPRHAVSMTFEFPPPVRSACEQYLLHFADFLRELGVEASVQLQEMGDHVLFAVAPHDRREALESVRSALDAYLHLSVADIVGSPESHSDEILLYKLRANISHLHSQLDLAYAQNAALRDRINAQELALQLLQGKDIRPQTVVEKGAEDGQLLNGQSSERLNRYVSLTEMKQGPFRIDVPQLLRDLRELFRHKNGA